MEVHTDVLPGQLKCAGKPKALGISGTQDPDESLARGVTLRSLDNFNLSVIHTLHP